MLYINKNKKASMLGFAALALITTFLPGCKKDFLDRKPLGQYTSDNYPYPAGGGPYDQFVNAAYASLRTGDGGNNAVSGFNFMGAVSIRSDDADKGSTATDSPDQIAMDNFPVTPTNGLINDLWNGYYSSINKCNQVFYQVGHDSTGTGQDVKTLATAEAKFIRAYDYFMLVRLWGKVPIIDTIITSVNQTNTPQSDVNTVYQLIEADLQYAAANLPLKWDAKYQGRTTSGSANTLLAKVYLTEKKWGQAFATASAVVNSGQYSLVVDYGSQFEETGENGPESIFEIQAYADATRPSDVNYGCQYANVQGVRGTDWNDLGWGFNVPSTWLANAYEAGDPRKGATFLVCPSPAPTKYGEIFPAEPNPAYNQKVYTNPNYRATVGSRFGWWMNIRILRYADLLLMYAEAANEVGNSAEALDKLEMVRARARAGNDNILPKITTTNQADLRTAIQHERRIELALEQDRFFDIVRWGIATNAEHAAGKSNFTAGRDELLPIPQQQIDLSKGVLNQNPGY